MEDHIELYPEVKQELQEALRNNDKVAAARIREYIERQNNIPLRIGITGESGSGKSSFVNAFRGMSDDDEGAAPAGAVETTKEVTEYPHPSYPNVILYDLPGIGTTRFPADKYLEQVGFKTFDFFIIVSSSRFRQNDVKLAKEIKKKGKKFYFVRSKIDNDVRAEQRRRNFNEEETLNTIRESCVQGLREHGCESPQVFLVSSFNLQLYDFSLLQETLERDLPAHKRDALLLANTSISPEVIARKKKAFLVKIWCFTALSGVVAGVPVPGLSVDVDLGLIVSAVTIYVVGFGLDRRSLRRLADKSGVSYEDLCAVIKSPLSAVDITKDLIMKVVLQSQGAAELLATEEVSRFIPIIGIPLSMGFSAVTTYKLLKLFFDMLSEDALRVSERVLSVNPSL